MREEYERGFSSAKKRHRTSQYSEVNEAVWEWIKKKIKKCIPVDANIIQKERSLASLSSRRQAAGLQALKSATTFHNTNTQVNLLTGQSMPSQM